MNLSSKSAGNELSTNQTTVVIVQHSPHNSKNLPDELAARYSDMIIHQVEDDMVVEPNHIYLIPPQKDMILRENRLYLTERDKVEPALSDGLDEYRRLNELLETRILERTKALEETNAQLKSEIAQHRLTLESLKRSEKMFADFIEVAAGGILIVAEDGRIVQSNKSAEKIFGYDYDELIGQSIECLITKPDQESHIQIRTEWMNDPVNGGMREGKRVKGLQKDGTEVFVLVDLSVIETSDSKLIMAHVNDITAFQEAEAALAQRAEELARSNKELENFAYVVSHDLRAPLRALKGYSSFLNEDYGDAFNGDAQEFIQGIYESANRLDQLLQDILAYSRVGQRKEPLMRVDTLKLINELVNNFNEQERAEFNVAPDLPIVWAYETRLHQIFSNLLSNAVKYSQPDIIPTITIDWKDEGAFYVFIVQDNGIGIEEKHFERIFGIFQRLHTDDEYTGTGIGLAIVQKAVSQFGGEIRVSSTPGLGSTFAFTIPKETI
ncbi:MAG: PAS domain S-box protein [Anaerolineales bacterium]|nr:PAS domain S-box protein [Anaerolineales bacterium]